MLGEFFRGNGAHGLALGEFFRAHRHRNQVPKPPPLTLRPGRFLRHCPLDRRDLPRTRRGYRHPANLSTWAQVWSSCASRTSGGWGVCSIRRRLSACRRRVGFLRMQFPPINGVQAMTHVGLAPKLQTTSLKSAGNARVLARLPALWANCCPSRCVERMRGGGAE